MVTSPKKLEFFCFIFVEVIKKIMGSVCFGGSPCIHVYICIDRQTVRQRR